MAKVSNAKGKVKSVATGNWGVKGGKGHMFGQQAVDPMQPGQTAASAGGKSSWGVKGGGSGRMQKYTPVVAAKPGVSR